MELPYYIPWLKTHYGITEEQTPEVRTVLSDLCKQGPLVKEETILISNLYWKVG